METFLTALATSSVVAGLVTLGITRTLKKRDDTDLRDALKASIELEIELAAEFALAYLQPRAIRMPMHRITTSFYDENAAKLLALKGLNEHRLRALMIYYQNITQLNRSLDLALELRAQPELKRAEINRAFLKACSLVSVADLRRLAGSNAHPPLEQRSLMRKQTKYGAYSPYDRVRAAIRQ